MRWYKKTVQKLGFQFGIVMIAISTAPLILASLYLIDVNRTSIENATMELYSSTARMAALEVDNFVDDKKSAASEIAALFTEDGFSITHSDIKNFKDRFSYDPTLISIAVFDASGEELFVMTTKGNESENGIPETKDDYLAIAIQKESVSYFRYTDNLELITYSRIGRDTVLIVVNNATKLESVFDQHRFGRSGAVCLVSDTGISLYKPGYDKLPGDASEYSNSEQITELISNRIFGTSEGKYGGDQVLIAFAPTKTVNGGVLLRQEYSDAYYSSITLKRISIIGVIAGAILAALVSALFSGYLTRPLQKLVNAARRVSRGDYKTRVESKRSGEMGEMVATFNEMARSLEEKEGLARSNVELEQFAFVASHDLREPLRMISNYLQLLKKRYSEKLDEDAHAFIEFAVDGAERMKGLINDLLKYSRVGSHGGDFKKVECNSIVNIAIMNLQVMIKEAGADVTVTELPGIIADKTQLIELFQNLIGNGVKYSTEDTPKVTVSAVRDKNEWTFSIKDNGIGICQEDFQRVFALFTRLHGRDEYAGSGIGLAVCKKIVERHNGVIWVESEGVSGSTFYFTIPDFTGNNGGIDSRRN